MNDNLEMEKVGVITDGVGLSTDDFDYQLPDELIAQSPLKERDLCRLICLDKKSGNITHNNFKDLLSLLKKGDRLVFNNTRVVPARVFGLKDNGLKIEFLFIEKVTQLSWKALVGPARRLKTGSMVKIENCSEDYLRIDDVFPNGDRLVTLVSKGMQSIEELFEKFGHIPLPQYISRNDEEIDKEAYQTVFAEIPGTSVSWAWAHPPYPPSYRANV
jgi:S-adenosylmethionine:tRNA ribosyltransferase-isomerase